MARNDRVKASNTRAAVAYASGGVLAGAGLLLLLWPDAPKGAQAQVSANGFELGWSQRF